MTDANQIYKLFAGSLKDWHLKNTWSANPYNEDSFEHLLYAKNQIDSDQWHLEDRVRRKDITSEDISALKKEIDISNERRTNMVEKIEDYYLNFFKEILLIDNAKMNTETPGWAIDRLSILSLKNYHMAEETARVDVDANHIKNCLSKLEILNEQKSDLILAINQLFIEIGAGKIHMKVYRQMKMYNDPNLNPELYKNES